MTLRNQVTLAEAQRCVAAPRVQRWEAGVVVIDLPKSAAKMWRRVSAAKRVKIKTRSRETNSLIAHGVNMTYWYQRNPERFRREVELMKEYSRARLVKAGSELVWCERLRGVSGRHYDIAISYPARFPIARPEAFIVSPELRNVPHRFSNGALCLFDDPFAPDPRTSAAVVRNRTVAWILCFEVWQHTSEWGAPQH